MDWDTREQLYHPASPLKSIRLRDSMADINRFVAFHERNIIEIATQITWEVNFTTVSK